MGGDGTWRLWLIPVGGVIGLIAGAAFAFQEPQADSSGSVWAAVVSTLMVGALLSLAAPRFIGALTTLMWFGMVLGALVALFRWPAYGLAFLVCAGGVGGMVRLASWRIDKQNAPRLAAFRAELERVARESWEGMSEAERDELRAQGRGIDTVLERDPPGLCECGHFGFAHYTWTGRCTVSGCRCEVFRAAPRRE